MGRVSDEILIEDLIADARAAGLRLVLDGELLRMKGKRGACDIAKDLLERRAEVKAYLAGQSAVEQNESCPNCNDRLELQDRMLDCRFCSGCRKWFDGAEQPFVSPLQNRTRPHTREDDAARELLEDLKRAGCGLVFDEELRVTNIVKLDNGVLTRLENAGEEFRRIALEEAMKGECAE